MVRLAAVLLELALACGVPTLIAARAPRRWRVRALALWAFGPLLALLAVAGGELASGRSSTADLDKLVYGLLLIGSFAALPWLMACSVGYAFGAALRRRRPAAILPDGPAEPEPRREPIAYTPPPADPSAPTLSPPSGWHAAHVGFEDDGLELDGLPVWSLLWRQEAAERVMLAHPAHPGQRHAFTVYAIDDGIRATRFAAAELSNGVWGFYRWTVPANAVSGMSADGSLRYEHDPGPFENGRYDAVRPVARLHDARTGALLLDGAAWSSSRIVPQADGSLLAALEHREQQTIFRIDPAAGAFRDLSAPGGTRPLGELGTAAAAARAACEDPANVYYAREVAPDGSLLVELGVAEWGNSHWVRSPRVTEIASGRVLLDLMGTDWDAGVSFPRPHTVRLSFRRYHHGGGAKAEIDLAGERYVLFEEPGPIVGPLSELPRALEGASRRQAAAAGWRRPLDAPLTPARSLLLALAILVGALALVAIATLVTQYVEGEPKPQKLDTIPPMPRLR